MRLTAKYGQKVKKGKDLFSTFPSLQELNKLIKYNLINMEKILVVNNDIDTMTLIKDLLEKKAYKVKYTSSREESLHIAKNLSLILLWEMCYRKTLYLI